ncbi:MAG: LysM peptidoglycan-binding domain-containing protein [Cellvibrionaceae bacterium]|nr:LysM peptidoglycan-binding domain-containing protein [Cellvibrionaceae bacterium]
MWHRLLRSLFVTAVFSYSASTLALGLGEISLDSQYNEPLAAQIRLLKVRDLSPQEVIVSLGSRDDFRRAGVERPFFLNSLRFDVSLDNPAEPVIRVSSSAPVTEPYLNFLVEVQWPSGRLVREYTLLLDLPVFNEQANPAAPEAPAAYSPGVGAAIPAPVESVDYVENRVVADAIADSTATKGSASDGVSPSATTTTTTTERAVSAEAVAEPTTSAAIDRYRVKRGDTLWVIAEKTRPHAAISVNQAMVALQQANPEAFINDNINLLRSGRVLRVPSLDEIQQVSAGQAATIVQQQNRSWVDERSQQQPVLTTSTPAPSQPPPSQAQGRLTLASADGDSSNDSEGTGASASGDALRQELAVNQEELDRSRRENSELKAKIDELESQIDTMEKLLSMTNEQMRALELAVAADKDEQAIDDTLANTDVASETVDPPADQSPAAVTTEDTTAVVADSATDTATTETTTALAEPQALPDAIDTPAPELRERDTSATPNSPLETATDTAPTPSAVAEIIAIVKQNLLLIAGGVLALILVLLALFRLREKPVNNEDFDDFAFSATEEDAAFEATVDDDLSALTAGDSRLDDTLADDEPAVATDGDSDDAEDQEQAPVEAQTEDVVAEAEIYISLGQQDKAIALLQQEIQQNPDNADARLGLLKIHADAQDAAAFDDQYAQLLPLGNAYANDQAESLRSTISGVESFDTDNYSLTDALDPATDEPATDTSSDDTRDHEVTQTDDLDLDFALSDDALDDELSVEQLEKSLDDIDLGGLDVELDLDDLDDLDDDNRLTDPAQPIADTLSDTLDDTLAMEKAEPLTDNITEGIDIGNDDADAHEDFDLDLDLDLDLDDALLDEQEAGAVEPVVGDAALETLASDGEIASEANAAESPAAADDALDFEALPDDLDMASLDREIDEMTAELDEDLPDTLATTADDVAISEDSDISFLDETDEVATKLDLARAYLDMGDHEGAQDILAEVLEEGNEAQKSEAQSLMNNS